MLKNYDKSVCPFTKHVNWSSLIVNQNVKWGSLKTLNKKKYGLAVIFKHFCYIVKLLNSGNLWVFKNSPLLRGVRYWEVIWQRLSHLGLNNLPGIQGMSTIWDVRYWEVSLHLFGYALHPLCFESVLSISHKIRFRYPLYWCSHITSHLWIQRPVVLILMSILQG